jgi:hypothetical protein
MGVTKKHGMGWIPDYPDFRDDKEKTVEIKLVLARERMVKAKVSLLQVEKVQIKIGKTQNSFFLLLNVV